MIDLVYCGQCGQSNPGTNKFCNACGKPLAAVPPAKNEPEVVARNACPVCKRTDNIRKVSSISSSDTHKTTGESFSSGTATIYDRESNHVGDSYSSSSGYMNMTGQSELAKKVSLPARPPQPAEPKGAETLAKVLIGIFVVIGLGVGLYAGGQVGGNQPAAFLRLGACFGSTLLVTVVGGLIAMALTGPSQEQKQAYQEQLKIYSGHLAKWETACQRWEQMYYCYRDDVVFIPGEGEAVPPAGTAQLCYQNVQ